MTKEQKFYNALQDVFIGARIEGEGGFVNLMRIKSNYYQKIEAILKDDIEKALEKYPSFRDELFDKLYSFFNRYFTESGSIYFNSTPFHNNIYEKVYTNDKDVILFWKTQMLYYVKTDRIFRSLPIEFDGFKFYFDASGLENKKANEKRNLIYDLKEISQDYTIVFSVNSSERGKKTKPDEILKVIKRRGIAITEEQLERAFRVFEKQSEVDFFINKNAKAFLQEQFKLWSYQYFWEGAKEWSPDRVNQLQILKDIAFKIIDFISQFEDELVKIWNKPKFVKNSNYVITLDRIKDISLIEKVLTHKNIQKQIQEWQELGIIDNDFKIEDVFEYSPSLKGWHSEGMTGYSKLPYNPELKQKARDLRKAGNLSEVLLWNELKQKKMLGLDFTRQQVIGNYIVDFHCPQLNLVIEIDGESHIFKEEYDKKRDEFLKSLGLNVFHFQDIDVKKNLSEIVETIKKWIEENTPSALQTPLLKKGELNPKYKCLPIDTKYFKDLELEILGLFDDLDKSLDGWLIKSENYQALNTILPKFKEKVQTIYIDPPFNLDSSDQFLYRTNYKDANWATLLENRLRIAKDWMNERGSIFIRCDYNGNWIVRCLMDEIFGRENFRNEIVLRKVNYQGTNVPERFNPAYDLLYFYSNGERIQFNQIFKEKGREVKWINAISPKENRDTNVIEIDGRKFIAPKNNHWRFSQKKFDKLHLENRIKINEEYEYVDVLGNKQKGIPQYLESELTPLDSNWTDISGYSFGWGFSTENSEPLLKRVIESTSNEGDLVMDYFLGSGTTTAVAHKLGRKWLGVEIGEHFYTVVLPRMKKVLSYDKSGISKELKTPRQASTNNPLKEGNYYQGGGFFKYYELEQYEEVLANCKYEDGDLFTVPSRSPYQEYVFMKDEKMLKALEIDYENNKIKVDLDKLYHNTLSANADTPLQEGNIDIAETLSNLTGKWIKKIEENKVWLEGEEKPINIKELDYKLIKPLIWWE